MVLLFWIVADLQIEYWSVYLGPDIQDPELKQMV